MTMSNPLSSLSKLALSCLLVLSAALSACVIQSQFPVLPSESGGDAVLDCDGLEDELLRANALRDAILDEHGDVLALVVTTDVLEMLQPSVIDAVILAATLPGELRQLREYREAAAAAEARLIHVLTLKEARPCPTGLPQDSTRTEGQILSELEDLDRRIDEEELSQQAYRRERRELLDSIR